MSRNDDEERGEEFDIDGEGSKGEAKKEEGVKARIRKMLELGLHKDTGEHILMYTHICMYVCICIYMYIYIYIYMQCACQVTYQNPPRHTAIHCNALQRAATHCNTLRHTAAQDDRDTVDTGKCDAPDD